MPRRPCSGKLRSRARRRNGLRLCVFGAHSWRLRTQRRRPPRGHFQNSPPIPPRPHAPVGTRQVVHTRLVSRERYPFSSLSPTLSGNCCAGGGGSDKNTTMSSCAFRVPVVFFFFFVRLAPRRRLEQQSALRFGEDVARSTESYLVPLWLSELLHVTEKNAAR